MNASEKILILFSALSISAPVFAADFEEKERVLQTQSVETTIQLDNKSVLCTSADYSAKMLKVNIADLRYLTLFDHTNSFTGLPCVQGGVCTATNSPQALISKGSTVTTHLNIVLKEVYSLDNRAKTCQRTLIETVDVPIHQKNFHHEKQREIGDFPYDICKQL